MVEIEAGYEDDEVEAPRMEHFEGRLSGVGAGYPRHRAEMQLEVFAVDLLREHAVGFDHEGLVEAGHQQNLAHPVSHEVVEGVPLRA